MKHFIIMFHGISFISGISAITISIIAYMRYKNELIKYYILFIVAMGMLLLQQSISVYELVNNLYSNIFNIIVMVLSYISCSCLIYILPLFTYKLLNMNSWEKRKNIYAVLGLTPLICLMGKYIFNTNTFVWIANIVLFSTTILCIILIIRNFKNITNDKIKDCFKILSIFSILFFPYMYLDTKTEYIFWLSKYFPYGLMSIPIFYFTWNVVSIYWAIKYLKEKEFIIEKEQDKEYVLEEFYVRYSITTREKEVIALLVKGHSYQEICDQLSISLSTVKTHIRNIYQKTDVKNKIELINMINRVYSVV